MLSFNKLQLVEAEHSLYRLSDTVLYGALKFLEEEGVIKGYWQKVQGRGRPRRMYQISAEKRDEARSLGRLWHKYIGEQEPSAQPQQRQSG